MNPTHLIYLLFLIEMFLAGFWYTGSAVTEVFLLVAIVAGFRAVSIRHAWQAYALSNLMLVYLVWLFFVAFSSAVPQTSMMTLATLANLPVMYLVASNTPTFAEIWHKLRVIFFLIAVVLSAWAIWQVFAQIGSGHAVGPLKDRNLFAALINAFWFPAAYLFLTSKRSLLIRHKLNITTVRAEPVEAHESIHISTTTGISATHPALQGSLTKRSIRTDSRINSAGSIYRWMSLVTGCGLFMMSVALFATTSRGGIATWLLLLPVLLWAGYRNAASRRLIAVIPIIALLAYLFSALVLHSSIADRTFQLAQDPSTGSRLLLWQSSIKMALVHPFVGTGWGTFANYYPAFRSPLENTSAGFLAHNDYLQFAAEGGVPALLLLLGLLLGVLFQFRRSISRAADVNGLESIALLLGVLALFIHASVNHIFCVAFMNILAGLYLARAAQLTDIMRTVSVASFEKISLSLRRVVAGLIIVFIAVSVGPDLLTESINQQSSIKVANIVSPGLNAYKVAKFITSVKPQSRTAQEIVLRTAELALADNDFINRVGDSFRRELLNETLQRFDVVRAQNANAPNLGARQAQMLIAHRAILDADIKKGDTAYAKAHQVLSSNLKTDPYHTDSIIVLARLKVAEGAHADALQTLKQAEHRVFSRQDQQLIAVEILRLLAAPQIIPELAEIEKQLHIVNTDSDVYQRSVMFGRFNEQVDARLRAIASQIQAAH